MGDIPLSRCKMDELGWRDIAWFSLRSVHAWLVTRSHLK